MHRYTEPTHSTPSEIRRAEDAAHPGGHNGQGLVLVAGFLGYVAMFTAAIALSVAACLISV